MSRTVHAEVPVRVPADAAFEQLSDFASYAWIMRSVDQVSAVPGEPGRFRFVYSIGGIPRTFSIDTETDPGTRTLSWFSVHGPKHNGEAATVPDGENSCTLSMTVHLDLDSALDSFARATGLIEGRVTADLRRFATYVEELGEAGPEAASRLAEGTPGRRTPLQWLFDTALPTDETHR